MTNYDVMHHASREELATILASMAKGLLDDDGPSFKELRDDMLILLDTEVPT